MALLGSLLTQILDIIWNIKLCCNELNSCKLFAIAKQVYDALNTPIKTFVLANKS